jgi:hypothetical protein
VTLSATGVNIYGNLVLSSGINWGTFYAYFKGSSGTKYITSNGIGNQDGPIVYFTFDGANCTWVFNDNFQQVACTNLMISTGTIDFNDKVIQVKSIQSGAGSTFRRLYFRSSSITTSWLSISNSASDIIIYPGTSTLYMTSTFNPTYVELANLELNNLILNSGTGGTTVAFYGGGTIASFTNNRVSAHTMSFEAGKTFTFGSYTSNGSSTQQFTMSSQTPGSTYTISKSNSAAVSLSYCTISDFFAGNASVWKALKSNGNINNGNNYGIQFTPPQGKGLEFFS